MSNQDYEITVDFLLMNRTFKLFSPVGMVVHETATPNATDENEVKYYNSGNRHADVHGFIDYDSITQTAPWNERVNGAGPSANSRFIQIELCHFDDPSKFQEIWDRGVWLFAWVFVNILKMATVTKDNLMGHNEISEKWHETNHTDPYGFFADHGKTVDDFRADVQKEIDRQIKGGVEVESWKTAIMVKAQKVGLITDGSHKPDDPATKWFVLQIAINILKILGKGGA